jgi:tRNA threonylcarbamoyladenosine biosynthesis protein TsaE
MEIIFTSDNIEAAAKEFIAFASKYKVFAFTGELGAGKTTFINVICKLLGVKETVTSPTFAIIQEYSFNENIIYHMDLYRIKSIEEAVNAGVEDCLLSENLCMVEWPEKAISLFPPETVYSSLQVISNETRKLIVKLPQ